MNARLQGRPRLIGRLTRYALVLLAGVAIGGFLFARSLPRAFLSVTQCEQSCYRINELTGLLTSIGIQRVPALVPRVELESDQCIAIDHPWPEHRPHFVLFPKRDIKSIGSIAPDDVPYVLSCLAMVRELAERTGTPSYRVTTNGPGFQEIGYLHFHFVTR